jgi:hypothetical protein
LANGFDGQFASWQTLDKHIFAMSPDALIIDDRSSGDARSSLGTAWHMVTDAVMGGVSQGRLSADTVQGLSCLHISGSVSLENNGGFVQASLNLSPDGLLDASDYLGFEIEVYGNNEIYNLHLRTADTDIVWQSYRVSFAAPPRWQSLRLPFASFQSHRIAVPLDLHRLKRIGVVAIGREVSADVCVARVGLYR